MSTADGDTVGLVPVFESTSEDLEGDTGDSADADYVLSWSVYSVADHPVTDAPDLGEAEYALRCAVRTAAEALSGLELAGGGGGDPRILVGEVLAANDHHRLPDHSPPRATRVLSTAAHVDAIITVSAGLTPIGMQSASEARIADGALRPLTSVVRAARAAAISAILQSAWQS